MLSNGASPGRDAAPTSCPNACLTDRHREPWQASIAEGEAFLAD
ncbi:hypothetical protein [Mesorhizobium sp. J428]|nr:hypothetical protein [Mesorhizobium sp. J428]